MGKLNLSEEQNAKIAALVLWGISRKLKMEKAREEYEKAVEREKAVNQAAIMERVFLYDEGFPDGGIRKGSRIVDGEDAWGMGDQTFREEYLPIVKRKWMELFGLDYPLNYTPTFTEYYKPFLDAQRSYRKIAVEFLRIAGKEQEADEMEKAIDGYLSPKIAERLDKINDQFLRGAARTGKKTALSFGIAIKKGDDITVEDYTGSYEVRRIKGNDVEILKRFETLREAVEYAKGLNAPRREGLIAVWRSESVTVQRFCGVYNVYN